MDALVDVDGVLADFLPHLLERATNNRIAPADVRKWDVFSYLTVEEYDLSLALCAGYDFWAQVPVISGAVEGVEKLRSTYDAVRFLTAPWFGCDKWASIRMEWLMKHFGARATDVIFSTEKYFVRGALFIDDKPTHVERWAETNDAGHAVLYDAGYNKACTPPHRLMGWADLDRVLSSIAPR